MPVVGVSPWRTRRRSVLSGFDGGADGAVGVAAVIRI
jgi:hypothetical protein